MGGHLNESLERLATGDHACLLHRSREELLAALVPYIRIGLSRGEKCLLLCDEAAGTEILNGLKSRGVDIGKVLARGAAIVTRGPAQRSRGKGFDPDAMVAFFRSCARMASSEKYTGLRICVDMAFAMGKNAPRKKLAEYQVKLQAFLDERKALCLCLFGTDDFPAGMLLEVLRSHTHVIFAGRAAENFYFVPPARDQAGTDATRLLHQRLDHLLERHAQMVQVRRQAARLTRFRDIAASLLSHAAVPDLLGKIAEGVVSLGYRMCWIGMARPDGAVEPVASCGDKEGFLQQASVRWDDTPLGIGPVGVAMRKGKPDIIRDVARSPRFGPWRTTAAARGYVSVAAVPLHEDRKVIGALVVYAQARDAFDRGAIEELVAFALQASLVLQRAREFGVLSLSEERFRKLFNQIPAACFTYDRDGKIRHWNQHCRRLFGYPREEAEGKSILDLIISPADEAKTREILSKVFSGESFFGLEWRNRTAAGDTRWILTNASPYRGKAEAVELGISVNVDISEQMKYRRAVAESEARHRAIVEAANVIVVEIEPDGKVVLFNRAAERITGLTAAEAIGKNYLSFLSDRDREKVDGAFREVFSGREVEGFVASVRTPGGAERALSWNATGIRDAGGGIGFIVAVGVDISEHLRMEQEKEELMKRLARTQKMEAMGTIAGGIAHEFNNILGAIVGYADLIRSRIGEGDPNLPAITKIHASAGRAADLTAKLVGFARSGKYQVRSLSFNEIVSGTIPLLDKALPDSIEVVAELDPWPSVIEGDEGQLQHSLLDLCFNSRDAMPGGGRLTIRTGSTRIEAEDARRFHLREPGDYAFLEVKDTGEGMTEEVQKHIFEPFFTTRREVGHSGMGLPSVYGIVKNHDGGIHVESAPGEGTLVRIYLPEATPKETTAGPPRGDACPRGTETVLVVDDEPAIREMESELLGALGYRAIAAENGEDACRIFRERRGEIDLVLLDIIMPKMGGREAFRALREMSPGLAVLLSSGYSVEGLAQEILDEGANGFIQKPFTMQELARTIRGILDSARHLA
jgi:PAS domain S-box-containing protein